MWKYGKTLVYALVIVSYVTVLGIAGKHDDIELSMDKIGSSGFGIHFELSVKQ